MKNASEALAALRDEISRHADNVLLFLVSLDGVLADYKSDPAAVHVPAARLELLTRLQELPGAAIAVISGRPLDDLRARVPLGDPAFYIGLHGLETVGPGYLSVRSDAIEAYREPMRDIANQTAGLLGRLPGIRLERKGPIVALHTRDVGQDRVVWCRFQLLSAAADLVKSHSIRTLRGQDVLELLPNVGNTRADAVHAVKQLLGDRFQQPVFTVYIGPDWSDDNVLQVTGTNQLTVVVGRRCSAEYHIDSPQDLDSFITDVIRQWTR
jgi:trehalose 6-phosphate phosphatase